MIAVQPSAIEPLITPPMPFRVVNSAGTYLLDRGLFIPSLSLDKLLRNAEAKTGLSDLGDSQILTNLDILVKSFVDNREQMTFIAWEQLKRECSRAIEGRLLAEACFKRGGLPDPEDPTPPVFIIGLPRTGSTALHNILCQDPESRVPAFWRLFRPFPFPGETDASRRRSGAALLRKMDWVIPSTFKGHPMALETPDECLWALSLEGVSIQYEATFGLGDYRRHLQTMDWGPAMAFHKKLFSHLQREVPGKRWVLKAPPHLLRLKEIDALFPNARYIWTHRDPKKVLPSISQLFETPRYLTNRVVDQAQLGRDVLEFWSIAMERALAHRAKMDKSRLVDMCFSEFIQAPGEVAKAKFQELGIPLNREMELGIDTWVRANPKKPTPRPVPIDLPRYGILEEEVNRAFSAYIEEFQTFF